MTIPEIDVDDLASAHDQGADLVDVREPDEYVDGHVPGAVSIPLATVPDSLDAVPDGRVYVVCAKGGRSAAAVEFLRDQGVDAVNVAGGTDAWVASGRPTVAGEHPR